MKKEQIEAENKLADALVKLADSMEKFTDPIRWQKTLSDAVRMMPGLSSAMPRVIPTPISPDAPRIIGHIDGVSISLSEEERIKLVDKVNEAIQPELAEFTNFVRASIAGMPTHRLQKIADKIDHGVKPKLDRRSGCVFITADGEESYLGL